MGTICVYKGISDDFKEIRGSGKAGDLIKTFFPELNLNRCVLIKEGNCVPFGYELKDSDILFLREIPGATGVLIATAVIGVVCAGVAAGFGIAAAVKTKKLNDQMAKAERDSKNLSQKTTQLPFLKGASNRSALGNNIPFIMGSVYVTPYLLTNGFYSIGGTNGTDQFWNTVLVVGYSNAVVNNISIGNTVIAGYNQKISVPRVSSGAEKTEEVFCMKESDEPYMFHSGSYYDKNNRVEIRTEDEMTLQGLSEKVACTNYGDEIPHKFGDTSEYLKGITKELPENTRKIEICVNFNGLRKYDDGTWKKKKVQIEFYWAETGTENWNLFSTITPELNTDRTARFSVERTFSAAEAFGKSLSVKILRRTPVSESNSQETAYLCYINSWQYDAWKSSETSLVPCVPLEMPWRDRTLRIALRVVANDSTKDTLDSINCMAYGLARIVVKNPAGGYEWSEEKYPTRNPASWALEILTSDIHSHSRYSDSEIDLESLAELYLYCADNEFFCDGMVTEDTKKRDLLDSILSECNASMYMDYTTGKWTFAVEKEQSIPVALLNEQSVKRVTISKSFSRKVYAQKVSFTDRASWTTNTVYITKDGVKPSNEIYDKGKTITESSVKFITSYEHCYKHVFRQIAKQNLQGREVSVEVGKEGDYYPLYSLVLLQMKQLKIGLSGGTVHSVRTENGKITHIQTSDICDFSDTEKRYGIIIQAADVNGRETICAEVQGSGKTRILEVKTPCGYSVLPEFGNIYSFGYLSDDGSFSRITNKMMIYETTPSADGWTLKLKDYSEGLFSFTQVPRYVPNLTSVKETGTKMPSVTFGDLQVAVAEAKIEINEGNAARPMNLKSLSAKAGEYGIEIRAETQGSALKDTIKHVAIEISRDGGNTFTECGQCFSSFTYTFDRKTDGYPESETLSEKYRFRAKAVNIYGTESEDWASASVDVSSYGTWTVGSPKIETRISGRAVTLFLSQGARSDGKTVYGNIRHKVQVKKTSEDAFSKPAASLDPYASEENYKDGEGYADSGGTFQQVLPLSGQDASSPADTAYTYSVKAYNEAGSESESSEVNIIALATSVKDIVDAAITENKIAEGAVTVDKLHAQCITADKMYSTDLAAMNLTLGKLSGEGINAAADQDSNSFWDLENGEFRVGNDISLEDTKTGLPMSENNNASYLHYSPVFGLALALAKFVVTTAASIIKGVFRVNSNSNGEFITANPEETQTENTAARTLSVKGAITATGNVTAPTFKGALEGNAKTATAADSAKACTGNSATASKLGTSTVGSANKPVYLNSGTATACNEMVSISGNQSVTGIKAFSHIQIPTAQPSSISNGSIWIG